MRKQILLMKRMKKIKKRKRKVQNVAKTAELPIHHTQIIKPDNIPKDSKFKGYKDVVVQDIIIQTNNTCYRLAQYETPNGQYITGQLPEGIRDNHWGKNITKFHPIPIPSSTCHSTY